jgi:hypothetical protein
MKKWILRFFGLADDQLRGKKAKFNGWFCSVAGCTFLIGALLGCLYVTPILDSIKYKAQRCIKHIKFDAEIPQHNVNVLRALRMLETQPDVPKDILYSFFCLLFFLGGGYVHIGLMYLKLHSVLIKSQPSNAENGIAEQTQPHHPITKDNTMNYEETKTSIATSFRKLILILAVPSIVFSIFLIFLMGFIIYTYHFADQSYEGSRTVEVVVAKTNIVAGAVLGYDNLGVKRFTQSRLQTKDYVIEDHGYILVGHRIKKPLEINDPLTWHNTDIVLTNKLSR